MALLDVHCFSEALGLNVTFSVLLPQQTSARQIGVASGAAQARSPTLFLLHGLSDDHTIWLRRTSIERYAAAKNLAVVMPAAGRSFYQDMASGPKYWTFISEELPALCRQWFPLSAAREENFVAGLSMGGYGALRLALTFPERFAAAASLSGALDLPRRLLEIDKPGARIAAEEWRGIFGPRTVISNTDADLRYLARCVSSSNYSPHAKPKLYLCCGTDDELLAESRSLRSSLAGEDLSLTYEEGPGGHEWGYWDRQIQRVLDWLPLPPASPAR